MELPLSAGSAGELLALLSPPFPARAEGAPHPWRAGCCEVGFAAGKFPPPSCFWESSRSFPSSQPPLQCRGAAHKPVAATSLGQDTAPAALHLLPGVTCCPILPAALCQTLDSLPNHSFGLPNPNLFFWRHFLAFLLQFSTRRALQHTAPLYWVSV